jgi:hypothetical protein
LQILKSYVTELYDRTYRPKNLGVEIEEEVVRDEKYPYILYSEVENAIKQRRVRTLQEMIACLRM